MKDEIAIRVIEYYSKFESMHNDLLHTQEVVSYTRLIAKGEGLSQEQVDLMEAAAWLHDIGCPRSMEIYGNSQPLNQEKVGKELCLELFSDFVQCPYLAEVVGSHHQYAKAKELGFTPLFEADMIVNLLSGYHPKEKAPQLYKSFIKSKTGQKLFNLIYSSNQ